MEAIRLNKTIIGLLAIILVGLYLATVTVEPVFAMNVCPSCDSPKKPKNMVKGIKIDTMDKKIKKSDNSKKDKKDNSDTIKIKSHPVLKSPTSSSMSTTVYTSSSTQFNLTGRRPK